MVVPLALLPVPVAPQGDSAVVQVVRVIIGEVGIGGGSRMRSIRMIR